MSKTTSTSPDEVRTSVASIYSSFLDKRRAEAEEKAEKKRLEREAKEAEKAAKYTKEDGSKMTKKERREAELNAWKEIIIGLTGDDLEYSNPKKNKKKYKKWIDFDAPLDLKDKPKKKKKRNYQKEFDPELNMLKTIVADQNRFTNDLQRRFQNAAGPATKDAMPLNKTLVELAAAVNSSRANSLGLIREIGNLKKTIADLYMKQAKLDAEAGTAGFNAGDMGLMGSSIASAMFGDNSPSTTTSLTPQTLQAPDTSSAYSSGPIVATPIRTGDPVSDSIPEFDPSSWGGPAVGEAISFENVPKDIVVEWHKADGKARFKAVDPTTRTELVGCPVPTSDPTKLVFNEKDMIVKGEFDETYKLEIV